METWRGSPIVIELMRRMQNTEVFLKMAVIELRRIADGAPDIAVELRHMAQKLEAEADNLAPRDTDKTGPKNRDGSSLQWK